ncbi:type I DNA topoisomerase [Desulfoscipio gibsoniae]|uniref:DNA topoisomerase 1 n=1 Tax=Desulfoscipio gibsoniae DSM 7213 TaxID=767817 RepID=R4KF98_9FIRM|nr:type I DNA topoisomerase [Desulfoscipio gibsoniae]AGL01269.1 DNA topoisomerase I, bacterial [Desulfoscipio gibsoniae DSM 7213]
MAKTLVIVESPAKAKSLGKFLGKKYTVKASMGHVRDLPKSQFGVDIQEGFKPKYITIRGKGDIIKELKAATKKADKVLLASDPDREGEAIAWHLANVLNINEQDPCRIAFNEITKQAVQQAVKHPRPVDRRKVDAQQARRILDRLVGYNLSPLLWRKVKKGLSAGRVQSVAMRLICDREEEIQAFEPEEYWSLAAKLVKGRTGSLVAKLHKIDGQKAHIPDEAHVNEIRDDLQKESFEVAKITRREKKRQPALPFTTSSMQQEAYRKLNFTARKTMMVAQQLYEGLDLGKEGPVGLVTYIRTDSTRIAETAEQEADSFIVERFGAGYVPAEKRRVAPKGRSQDAHEGIRPTSVLREPDNIKQFLTRDQYRLYKLIWERFVASQMSPAIIDTTSVDVRAGKYIFRANGSIIKFPGFMQVYIEGRDDEEETGESKTLPELQEGEQLKLRALVPKQHFTQPPPRFTDATLIKTLEEKGIGRPSTYAPIVDTILKRGYVVREKKNFYPTELGLVVVDLLKKYFYNIIDVEFTAAMEQKLDDIEEGDVNWVSILEDFYMPFEELLEVADKEIEQIQVEDEVTDEVCELCGRNMVIKMGRYGKFLACPGFPECRNARPLLEPTGVSCPNCSGELVLRRSKKGRKFYGCSNYPECEFVVWDQPTNRKCPICGSMMVLKENKKGQVYHCTNKECGAKVEAVDEEEGDNHNASAGEANDSVNAY